MSFGFDVCGFRCQEMSAEGLISRKGAVINLNEKEKTNMERKSCERRWIRRAGVPLQRIAKQRKAKVMGKRFGLFAVPALLYAGIANAQQYPIMDKLADKVVQKYQSSSCQDLMQKKSQPQTGKREMVEEKAMEMLRKDPQMRTEFLNRVAGPIANKMFECGMIP